jgi:hypothetical protein
MSSTEEDHRGVRDSGPFGELLFGRAREQEDVPLALMVPLRMKIGDELVQRSM